MCIYSQHVSDIKRDLHCFTEMFCCFYSKWRTTPVVEEVFAEVSALAAGVAVVVAAGAVEEAAVPGEANLRIRR